MSDIDDAAAESRHLRELNKKLQEENAALVAAAKEAVQIVVAPKAPGDFMPSHDVSTLLDVLEKYGHFHSSTEEKS
jgi:hypothetical protein